MASFYWPSVKRRDPSGWKKRRRNRNMSGKQFFSIEARFFPGPFEQTRLGFFQAPLLGASLCPDGLKPEIWCCQFFKQFFTKPAISWWQNDAEPIETNSFYMNTNTEIVDFSNQRWRSLQTLVEIVGFSTLAPRCVHSCNYVICLVGNYFEPKSKLSHRFYASIYCIKAVF